MTRSEPVVAVVVAAGSGVRMGGAEPKALRLLGGKPLVRHSVESLAAGGVERVVVVVADGLQDWFAEVLAGSPVPCSITVGGVERQDSVRLGLEHLEADPEAAKARIVLVHDAARPLVPAAVTRRVIEAVAAGAPAVVPAIPVADTIRQVDQHGRSLVLDRSRLRALQTPQGFDFQVLFGAHAAAAGGSLTDDAAVCEALGYEVTLVEGSRESLKVTEPTDLALAEIVLKARESR